jgi:integrase/recombinase XerD
MQRSPLRQIKCKNHRHDACKVTEKRAKKETTKALVPSRGTGVVRVSVDALAAIPEEEVWLASRKSARTRRAYRHDVAHFMRTFDITSPDELRKIDHRAVMTWERLMREQEGKEATTVRRRLAALSSLFVHLVKFGVVEMNPVRDVERPAVNRREGMTLAFSQAQARKILDTPKENTVLGLRDRAILSVGLQVGFRRAEIASLTVGDFHMNRGYDSLKVVRKGGKKGSLAIHPQTAQRIRDYLEKAKHHDDLDGPLFRPVRGNREGQEERRHLHPDVIDRILRKYAKRIGLDRGYSAHSMRATFITTALDNGASLEDVQRAAGHADPSTTKLYDRRGYNPEKSASFFANY